MRHGTTLGAWFYRSVCILVAGLGWIALPAAAEERDPDEQSLLQSLISGKVVLDVRARIEVAEIDGLAQSEAYTIRTRLGYGTKPFHGLSAYADFENVAPIAPEQYANGTGSNPGKTPISDPKVSEINQAFGKIAREDWLDSSLIGGIQRIALDDARFIGDVDWRQNQQTFDSLRLDSTFGVEDLRTTYSYLWKIRRIFGDQGSQPNWNSRSHILNASYGGLPAVGRLAGFIYLLDFRDSSAGNSSATYGFRVTGDVALAENWKLLYQGSYAYQTDYGSNPANYQAHYVMVDAKLANAAWGGIGVGYELLGSDDGANQFVTPLATAHKFNGWADAYLNNGGPTGLQDIYLYLRPKLPCKFSAKLVYHHFLTAEGSRNAGIEFDAVLKRPINKYFSVLTKFAYFEGKTAADPSDRWRYWLQAEFKF